MHKNRKYSVDEKFFSSIDSEEKAYVLGYLTGDGCITKSKGSIRFISKDLDQLEKIRICLKSTHLIKRRSNENSTFGAPGSFIYHYTVYSSTMIQDLEVLGLKDNKTGTILVPTIPQCLLKHYWRGLIDADGTIHVNINNRQYVVLLCSLSEDVADKFSIFCRNIYHNTSAPKRFTKGVYDTRVSGIRGTYHICKVLYEDASIFLTRKYNNWIKIRDEYNQHAPNI